MSVWSHCLVKSNRWPRDAQTVRKDIVVLPKSVTPERISSNYTGATKAAKRLDDSDVKTLDGLAANGKQKRSVRHACCSALC